MLLFVCRRLGRGLLGRVLELELERALGPELDQGLLEEEELEELVDAANTMERGIRGCRVK